MKTTSEKCAVCTEYPVELVRVTYSRSPFGEDSDTVKLCARHAEEASNLYDTVTIEHYEN